MKTKKQLGMLSALFVAMGATIGTGIVLTQGTILTATGSVLISVIGWVIAGLLILPQMMVQSEMTSAYPNAGGPYVFFKKAKLKNMAFMYGWAYAIWGWPFSIAFRAFVTFQFLNFLLVVVTNGHHLDPWILRTISATTIIVFGLINYFSVKAGAFVNNLLTIAKLGLIFLIIVIAFFGFNSANFSTIVAQEIIGDNNIVIIWFKGITISVALAIWSYNGINTIAYMAPEFKNPQKNLPIVMIGGTLLIIAIYALFVIAIGGLLSASEAIKGVESGVINIDQVVLAAIKKLNLVWVANTLIFLLFLLSLSTVFTYTKVAPRLPYAMAKDDLFFKSFAKINKYNTPGLAILFNTFLSALLSFIPYSTDFIVIFFTFGTAIMNFLISLTILRCSKNADYQPVYRLKHRTLVLTCSIVSCLFVAASGFYTSFSSINTNWLLILAPLSSLLVMGSAFPVYAIWQKVKTRQSAIEVSIIN